MPIYEYICENCGKLVSLLLSISKRDDLENACPICGRKKLQRKVSRVSPAKVEGSSYKGDPTCNSCSGGSCSTCGR